MGRRIDPQVREKAMEMYMEGMYYTEIALELGLNRETVSSWIKRGPGVEAERKTHTLGTVRQVLCMLDEGVPLKTTARHFGIHPATVRRWRDYPHYRESTYEYDPNLTYDINDLMDRATVAQHLCSQVRCDGRYEETGKRERLELLMAVVEYGGEPEHTSPVQVNVFQHETWRDR